MATTPKFSWPVPVAANAPNVPFDMNALAVAIEGTVGGINDRGRRAGGQRGSTDQATGNADVITVALPSSPAGSVWLVNVFAQIKPLNQADRFVVTPTLASNCTPGSGSVFWHIAAGTTSVVPAMSWELVVTATGVASVIARLSMTNATTNWEVQSNTYWNALRIS